MILIFNNKLDEVRENVLHKTTLGNLSLGKCNYWENVLEKMTLEKFGIGENVFVQSSLITEK